MNRPLTNVMFGKIDATTSAKADDVAAVIVDVLELQWVTGQTIFADGGLALHSPIDAYGQLQRVMNESRRNGSADRR